MYSLGVSLSDIKNWWYKTNKNRKKSVRWQIFFHSTSCLKTPWHEPRCKCVPAEHPHAVCSHTGQHKACSESAKPAKEFRFIYIALIFIIFSGSSEAADMSEQQNYSILHIQAQHCTNTHVYCVCYQTNSSSRQKYSKRFRSQFSL